MEFPNFFFIFVKILDEWYFATKILKICVMKIIYNNIIPAEGFCAMSVGPWIFARKKYEKHGLSEVTVNHENCHWRQQCDFIIPIIGSIIFYIWYHLEWILKLPSYFFGYDPYMSISFEIEAYENQNNLEYLKTRKRFAWLKNIFKLKK